MKKLVFIAALLLSNFAFSQSYDFKIVTTVESIVPGGLGRSRIIENGTEVDYTQFTTTRSKDGKEKTSKDRSDVKIDDLKDYIKKFNIKSYSEWKVFCNSNLHSCFFIRSFWFFINNLFDNCKFLSSANSKACCNLLIKLL